MTKQLFTAILFLLTFSQLVAQGELWYEPGNVETRPCGTNPDEMVRQPVDWLMYQTLNGEWNGPLDSSRCITMLFNLSNNREEIPLSQVDPTKPLFIRWKRNQYLPVWPDIKYHASVEFEISDCNDLITGSNCVQDLCSGLFVSFSIPDSMGTPQQELRFHTVQINGFGASPCLVSGDGCLPTEYFDDQKIGEVIFKLTFQPDAVFAGKHLYLYRIGIIPGSVLPAHIIKAEVPPTALAADGEYHINMYDVSEQNGAWDDLLAVYNASTYPSAAHPYYIEVYPTGNITEKKVINLEVEQFQNLEIQPWVQFRGGGVIGNDTLRHQVNLVNNGGEFCFNWIDLIFEGGDEYRHGGGDIYINNAFSCMQFRNGSALRVMEGESLHYGREGSGMLALCAEGSIVLEPGAALTIDSRLNLSECRADGVPRQIYMDLPPNTTLSFTRNASLSNQFSVDQQMKLNIRMLGGTLDDWRLDPASRSLINRIYPEPQTDMMENISFGPNPFVASAQMTYIGGTTLHPVVLEWYTTDGRLMYTEQRFSARGVNTWALTPDLPAGIYIIKVSAQGKSARLRVCKG